MSWIVDVESNTYAGYFSVRCNLCGSDDYQMLQIGKVSWGSD